MSLYVLNAVCWLFGVRGPDRQDGEFPVGPKRSSSAANANWLMRVLAASAVAIASLSLLLWAAAWLALKWL
jgi:hypothetical protein